MLRDGCAALADLIYTVTPRTAMGEWSGGDLSEDPIIPFFCHLCRKIAAYDEEIQHLYEEMEQQIKSEREQFLLKVSVHPLGLAPRASWADISMLTTYPKCEVTMPCPMVLLILSFSALLFFQDFCHL